MRYRPFLCLQWCKNVDCVLVGWLAGWLVGYTMLQALASSYESSTLCTQTP